MKMRTGDMFIIKPGCGDEGKMGILIGRWGIDGRENPPWDIEGGFLYTVLLEGVQTEINGYWILPLDPRAGD